jgi:hypothetical protein
MTDAPLVEACATFDRALAFLVQYCGGYSYFRKQVALCPWNAWTHETTFLRDDGTPYVLACLTDADGYELHYVRSDGLLGHMLVAAHVIPHAIEAAA